VLLSLPYSAYQALIAMDDEAVYVLTSTAAYRIVVGEATQTVPLDLGFGATITAHTFLFWSEGAIWEAPKRGGKAERLGVVPHRPQTLVASGSRFAWVDLSEGDQFTIQALQQQETRIVYSSPGRIDTSTMVDDEVFFVERVATSAWHLGRVRTSGGNPTFTSMKRGRTPAMLAAFGDHIYYQDVNALKVVRLSRDFQSEETLAEDLVCSPLAVWERVYCAQVEGLVEVFGKDRPPRALAANHRELITAIAANSRSIAWLSDAGPDQLTVKLLPRIRD
jgi:hypothetical protein